MGSPDFEAALSRSLAVSFSSRRGLIKRRSRGRNLTTRAARTHATRWTPGVGSRLDVANADSLKQRIVLVIRTPTQPLALGTILTTAAIRSVVTRLGDFGTTVSTVAAAQFRLDAERATAAR